MERPRSKVGPLKAGKPCAKSVRPYASRLVRKWAASRQLPKILRTTFPYLHHACMHEANIFLDVFGLPCLSQPLSTTHKPRKKIQNDPGENGSFAAEIHMGNGVYMEQAHTRSACTLNIMSC
jgi:hypothetical protein